MDIDSHSDNSAEGAATPTIIPKPHDALWFPDGNVVLPTNKYLFRVHKGVLSLQSSVFKDMFEPPTVDDSNPSVGGHTSGMVPEQYEGLPLVTLVGDNGDDMLHLLRAAYERRYYKCEDDDTHIDIIAALLQLSTKYDFKDICSDVTKQLLGQYPTTLREYEVRADLDKDLFGIDRYDCHEVLLKAASVANVEILLSTLYYACSDLPVSYLFNDMFDPLDPPCLQRLLCGKDALAKAINPIICMYLDGSDFCMRNHLGSYNSGSLLSMEAFIGTSNLSRVSWKNLEKEWPHRVCAECKGTLETSIEDERAKIWDKVPSFFGLPDWKTIRAMNDVTKI